MVGETLYLVWIYTYVPNIHWLLLYSFQLIVDKWQPFWYFSFMCYPVHIFIETSSLVWILTYTSNIWWLQYVYTTMWSLLGYVANMALVTIIDLWCESLWIVVNMTYIDSYRGFILHILMYLFFTHIDKWNNATVTYFLKFMNTYSILII